MYLREQLHKIEIWKKYASAKLVLIYAANLNKNRVFQKIDCEKSELCRFSEIKGIFTQPMEKKGKSFADKITYVHNQ